MRLFKKIIQIALSVLLLLIICYPAQLQPLKVGLLFLIFALSFLAGIRIFLSTFTFFSLAIIAIYNFSNLFKFSLAGYPFAQFLNLFMATPLIFVIVISIAMRLFSQKSIAKLILWAGIYISIININAILIQSGWIPQNPMTALYTGRIGIHQGYVQIVDYGVYSLFFIFPFAFVMLSRRYLSLFFLIPANLLIVAVLLLTGRRALWLASVMAILVYLIMGLVTVGRTSTSRALFVRNLAGGSLLTLLLSFMAFRNTQTITKISNGLYARLTDAFIDKGSGGSVGIRASQEQVLLTQWLDAPIWGNGIAVPARLLRSQEFTSAYEAFYHALLYQLGLFGFILYAVPTLVVLFGLIWTIFRRDGNAYYIACGMGLLSILIGSYSNPYLGTFDALWMLFIPVMAFNQMNLDRRANQLEAGAESG